MAWARQCSTWLPAHMLKSCTTHVSQTTARHQPDTNQTPTRQQPDTNQTAAKHQPDSSQTLSKVVKEASVYSVKFPDEGHAKQWNLTSKELETKGQTKDKRWNIPYWAAGGSKNKAQLKPPESPGPDGGQLSAKYVVTGKRTRGTK